MTIHSFDMNVGVTSWTDGVTEFKHWAVRLPVTAAMVNTMLNARSVKNRALLLYCTALQQLVTLIQYTRMTATARARTLVPAYLPST